MQVNIVKRSSWRIPRSFLADWTGDLVHRLKKDSKHKGVGKSVTLAFVEAKEMKALNKKFRKKNVVTDVLSFDGFGDGDLGDLVLCGEVLTCQAADHGLTPRQELGYLVIHGLLHLLGYDHENGGKEAKIMFQLQDELFQKMWPQHFKEPFDV